MSAHAALDAEALASALSVLDAHLEALNARDEAAIAATLHFPHYRLAGGRLQIWDGPAGYLDDFLGRAGEGWARSRWDFRRPLTASRDKVHLDVQFTRLRADGSAQGAFRSLWVVARLDGRWAAQLRSSFAG